MAIRNIVKQGDSVLTKKCRPVEKFDSRLFELLDDMKETLAQSGGVGLAAPQVGVLKRVVVIDTGEKVVEFINPEVIKTKGVQQSIEGCLSCPDVWGITNRPMYATIKAQDRQGNEFTMDGEGLLAKAFCHECDHLEGILFTKYIIKKVNPAELSGK
ncbi:MAG: peptide deformylase [Acutalibacteraceae bacterium]